MSDEIKKVLDEQGKAFEAFKSELEGMKKADVVTAEKLQRIETSLDAAVEAKAAIDRAIAAEKKEREELELRLQRAGKTGQDAKAEAELKSFNLSLESWAAERKTKFEPIDADGLAAYSSTWNKFLRKDNRLLTADEIKTLSVGSDPDGGYLVTPNVNGRIVNKIFETSEIRQIASSMTIGTDALEGIEDRGEAGAGYAGEQAQGGDTTTPQLGKWRIVVHWIDTEPKTTQQVLDDANVDVEAWLAGKVADKMARFENAEFLTGAAGKIQGLFNGVTASADSGSGVTWPAVGYVATGTSGDFGGTVATTGDKLFDLIGTLKNGYLPNARWITRRSVITKIRKFKDGQGNYLWQPSFQVGQPESLCGYPISRMEDVPALAANSYSMAFGDFRQAYQIVDRQGIKVLRDPYTAKPFVKFYTTKRVGGGVLDYEAYKLMKFGTS